MQKVLMFQCAWKSIPALTAHAPFTSQVKIRKQDDYYNNNWQNKWESEIRIKMPPKKKGGGKKKAGKKTGGSKGPTIIDGVPVSEMTKEQLEGHVRRLQEEVCTQ